MSDGRRTADRRRGPHADPHAGPRGSVFLPILLVAMVSATIAIGGLLVVNAHSRSVQLRTDAAIARANAVSAIEIARARITKDPFWRTNNSGGAWVTDQAVSSTDASQGTYSISVVNPMGALSRSDADAVVITGTGKKGSAYQTMSVTLLPGTKTAYTCLTAAISAVGTISISGTDCDSGTGGTKELTSANGDVVVTSPDAQFKANMSVQASGVITGKKFDGTTTTSATALTFPDASTLFSGYTALATAISTGSLTNVGGVPTMQLCVLSPASNPYGTVNSQGIYKIDCGGGLLTIKNCRIAGTLIVTNASQVTLDGAIVWDTAATSMPCLLVQGKLLLTYGNGTASQLKENGSGGNGTGVAMNFNPTGTPYPYSGGTTNTNTTDNLTTLINGVIYCSGDADVEGITNFHTLVVGGNLTLGNYKVRPTWDSTYSSAPPQGFYSIRQTVVQGTYQ